MFSQPGGQLGQYRPAQAPRHTAPAASAMRSAKTIAESLEGEISVEPEWLGEHVSVLLVFGWSFYRQGTSGSASSADEFLDAVLAWFGDPRRTASSEEFSGIWAYSPTPRAVRRSRSPSTSRSTTTCPPWKRKTLSTSPSERPKSLRRRPVLASWRPARPPGSPKRARTSERSPKRR